MCCVNVNTAKMATVSSKDRFEAAVKVIQSLPKNGKSLWLECRLMGSPIEQLDYGQCWRRVKCGCADVRT